MRCYKCNSVLSDTDFCNSCGADVALYKKIVKMSNTYYNMGLEKAKVRDLTGASDLLRRSVRMDKRNIKARNLLGLVYFEMGECVEALSEWVISRSIQPEKNIADKYIEDIQSNPTRLELINQTTKKFNTALTYANEGSDDLAIVQLKRVLSLAPNFIRAAQLLALLYIKNEEYEKARKVLLKVEKIDTNNTLIIKYMKEIDSKLVKDTGKSLLRAKGKDAEERPPIVGDELIIPQGYKEGSAAAVSIFNVFVGILIGAALVFFLITPAREKQVRSDYNTQVSEYAAQIASNQLTVDNLNATIADLEAQVAQLEEVAGTSSSITSQAAAYDSLLAAVKHYIDGNITECADSLAAIDTTIVTTQAFTTTYTSLIAVAYPQAADAYYTLGTASYDAGNYDAAIESLTKAYTYSPTEVRIVYNLARAYRTKNGRQLEENSTKFFNLVVTLAPDSEYAVYARNYLGR